MKISPVIWNRIVSMAARQAWRLLFGIGLLALCAGTAAAAIAVDKTVSKDQGTSSKTVATAAFSTASANELLLAFISTDGASSGNTTVSSIAGGGLAWVLVRRTNTQLGTSEIWRAFAPAVLTSVTVTATLSVSTASSMTVMTFTGTDTTGTGGSGAIGATGTGNSAKGAPTASLMTTRNNSLVIGVGNDWDNAISRTPGTGQTVVHQYLAPAGDTYWVQQQNSATPASGTTVTINDTAPSTDRYNLTIAEILAPATAAPTITATLGTPQSAMVTATFATALQATVKDSSGNLLSGASVTFTAPATTGPSGTFGGSATATVSTGTNGVAVAPAFTADTLAGGYTVTATTTGATSPASFSLTNIAGPPMSVAATAGASQSATIKTAFTTALQATVRDANNNPVSGASVIFVAPATGASGTFSNGTATITVATAATGVASAPFTANAVAGGPYSVTATVSGLTPVSFSLTNNPGPAASIAATAGASQSAMIGSAFTTALQATVTDGSSNPIVGASVIFTAPATGASGTFSNGTATITVLTVTGGVATAAFTANTVAGGPYTVTAKTGTLTAANFSLTNNPGPASSIAATAGGSQSATVNTAFTTALQAKVTDASNNPLSGVQVTFTAPGSGTSGTFSNGTATIVVATASTGVASAPFTANGTPGGPYLVTASAAGVAGSVSFSLTNNSAPPANIAATAGNSQSTMIGSAFTISLQATVTDAGNNPVVGASVTFTAPATGASGTFSNGTATISVATDSNGMATEAFTANTVAGGPYTVTAKTGTLTANFSLTNNPGPASSIAATAGGSQSATVNTAFTTALQAKVTDASNNPLSGVQVTFTAPGSGASGTFSNGTATIMVATASTGLASAPFTANGTPGGPYLVTASAAGVTPTVSFSLTNNALPPANIAVTGGTPQNIMIGTAFTTSLQATVTDAGNNPVVGASVTFTAPATGASGTFSNGTATISVATDSNGMATEAFTANTVAGGPYTVTAKTGTLAAANFSLTNNPGPASNIAATAGGSQSATVNTAFTTALQATVTDASNNPLSGVQVTFTAPASGASGTFSNGTATITIATGTNGVASAPFTANATAGGPYTVTAVAAGVTPTASFSLTNNASAPAALAIDVTTSTDAATAKTTVVTPSFSTKSASELLLAFVSTDQISSPNTTVTGVTGGGLTWVMVYRTNVQNGDAEIWRAFAPSTLSGVTVTATLSQSVVSSITVVSFTGADSTGTNGSGAIGATGSGNSAKGAPTASLVTTRNGSWVFGVGNDFDKGTARTLGTGQTLVHQDLAPVGDTYWVQRQTNTTPTSGTTVTINDTAPTGDDFNLSIVEVLPSTGQVPVPDLTVTKSHSGNFVQGQTGATYTITVTNSGGAATSGTVTLTDTLPASLTATAISGTNWNCTLATLTCTRSDTLAPASSYPAITLTVNVSASAPGSVTNTATVSGGSEANTSNDSASDVTAINAITSAPDLTVTKTHSGSFAQGQTGAAYTITVTNSGGSSTSGTVTVTDTVPAVLTPTAMSGTGWSCTLATATCTRSDALTAGQSYPAITLTVTVSANAPASITNSVTVSGGGETNTSNDTANDVTTVTTTSSSGVKLVQENVYGLEGTSSSMSLAFTSNNTAGNFLIVTATAARPASTLTVSDTLGNTYTAAAAPVTDPAQEVTVYIWYVPVCKGGANTVKIVPSTTAALEIHLSEWSGLATTSPVDQSISATGTGTSVSSGSQTTTANGELIYGKSWVANDAAAGAGFTSISLVNGDMDEYEIQPAAGSVAATFTQATGVWFSEMVTFKSANGGVNPGPAISMLSPAPNATVTSMTNVTANVTDLTSSITGVQFLVDGNNLGAQVTSAPYSTTWNSSTATAGTHSVSAIAYDSAGLSATALPVSVTVDNSGNTAVVGSWSSPVTTPAVAVNLILLHNNKLLFYQDGSTPTVWDYVNNVFTNLPTSVDLFCSGATALSDGRILIVGGYGGSYTNEGIPSAEIFDPAAQSWTALPNMKYARWYPTATPLSDGTAIVTAGWETTAHSNAGIPEIYSPTTNNWTQLTSANNPFETYPFIYMLGDGRLIHVGGSEYATVTETLNLTTQTWTTMDARILDGGSSSMYLPGKIVKAGSASDSQEVGPSSNTTFVLDTTQPSPAWQQTPSMAYPRSFMNLTELPDGTVLATGGETDKNGGTIANAVYAAELWSPQTMTWTTMASMHTPREYHGTALLLPDGRVVESGMGADFGNVTDELSAEFYSPPYLFKGARPSITQAPTQVTYGQNFTVTTPDAATITSVVMIRTGAVTHFIDQSTRFVPVTFQQTTGGLTVTAPANANLAQPGYYMLFIVNSSGVPSVAPFVQLQ